MVHARPAPKSASITAKEKVWYTRCVGALPGLSLNLLFRRGTESSSIQDLVSRNIHRVSRPAVKLRHRRRNHG